LQKGERTSRRRPFSSSSLLLFDLLDELTRNDSRFLFFDSSRPASNYNCNANQVLTDAIGKGFRGAYWDILRRCGGS
jgi:hypothetical protein